MGGESRTEAGPPPPSPDDAMAQFVALPGVGEKLASRLVAAGYLSLAMLAEAKVEALQEIDGIGPKSAERILQVARDGVGPSTPVAAEEPPDAANADASPSTEAA
jgi:3-methyladenine DNA glycosylase/8-oxoguanine DNA glycosylase